MNSSFFDATNPILAPHAENLFETESITIKFSLSLSMLAKLRGFIPSYTYSLYASSAISHRSFSITKSAITSISSAVSASPVGFPGLIQTIALVLSVRAASSLSLDAYRYPSFELVGIGLISPPLTSAKV